jgi:hypothetical protein
MGAAEADLEEAAEAARAAIRSGATVSGEMHSIA